MSIRWLAPVALLSSLACGGRSSFEDEPVPMLRGGAGGAHGGKAGAAGQQVGGASGAAGLAGAGAGGSLAGGAGAGGSLAGGAGAGGSLAGAGGAAGGGAGAGGAVDPCLSLDCDDGVACTSDACVAGACVHTPVDSQCHDAQACNGVEVCDPSLGCVSPGLSCDDGVACTVDVCAEPTGACASKPDDSLCPVSHTCDASEGGCSALAYAHSVNKLYEVRLPSGKDKLIGPLGTTSITDIALTSDGTLYALTFNALLTVDTKTAKLTPVVGVKGVMDAVGMDAGPDGALYVAASSAVLRLLPSVGVATKVASFPPGTSASGDLAFLDGRLLGTANAGASTGPDVLVELDLVTGAGSIVGSTGFDCIWGLAAYGSLLYGLTCNGEVLSIDPATGAGSVLSTPGVAFWGASAR
ncbi:MAG: hypothetical protein IT374_07960 [Polyangiaceae bacterium]|nr:hypothetical protein [Polyangiaceae bacterium]